MKSLVISAAVLLSLSTLCSVANAAKLEDVAPYPKAEAGFSRQVIHLPKQKNEDDYKVQIIAGKTLQVDCNQQRLGGKLEEKTLKGWGYPMYRLNKVSGPLSTMMACRWSVKALCCVTTANCRSWCMCPRILKCATVSGRPPSRSSRL